MILVLLQPRGDRGSRDVLPSLLVEACCCLLEAVAEVVVRDRRQDHAKGVGLVVQGRGARRERTLARRTAPELDDLEFLSASATTREHVAARCDSGWDLQMIDC